MGTEIVPPARAGDGGSRATVLLSETVVRLRNKDGVERRVPILEAAMWPLWEAWQVRDFPAYKGQRHVSGLYWWSTSDHHVGFESRLEEAALKRLDFDETVVEVASQPCELLFADGRRHTPDFAIRLSDGRSGLVDVSMREAATRPRKAASFAATRAACAAIGWEYRVETEADPVVQANIDWLANYRRVGPEFESWAPLVRATCEAPQPFGVVARLGQSPFLVPAVGHLLWKGDLGFDLSRPLRESTVLWRRHTNGRGGVG